MTSSWQGSKAKYGSPVESTAVAAERERRLSVGSRSSGLDASAPIWTPPPKQSQGSLQWSRQAHSPVSPISPHGFSGESQMYAMQQSPYQYQYHQHQQQSTPPHGSPYGNRGRGVQRGLKYHHHHQQQQQQQGCAVFALGQRGERDFGEVLLAAERRFDLRGSLAIRGSNLGNQNALRWRLPPVHARG